VVVPLGASEHNHVRSSSVGGEAIELSQQTPINSAQIDIRGAESGADSRQDPRQRRELIRTLIRLLDSLPTEVHKLLLEALEHHSRK